MKTSISSRPKWTTNQSRSLIVGFLSGCGTFSVGVFIYVLYLAYGSHYLASDHNGYKLNIEPYNYRYIRMDEETVVNPAIIEYNFVGEYIVGLRMPVQKYRCHGYGGGFDLINEKWYFILSTDTGSVLEFDSREVFERELREMGIGDTYLDYSKFYYMAMTYPPMYNEVDHPECVPDGASM